MKKLNINELNCNENNKNVNLQFLLSKPKVKDAVYRLQKFNCSNQDYCMVYKEKRCKYSELWKEKTN